MIRQSDESWRAFMAGLAADMAADEFEAAGLARKEHLKVELEALLASKEETELRAVAQLEVCDIPACRVCGEIREVAA